MTTATRRPRARKIKCKVGYVRAGIEVECQRQATRRVYHNKRRNFIHVCDEHKALIEAQEARAARLLEDRPVHRAARGTAAATSGAAHPGKRPRF